MCGRARVSMTAAAVVRAAGVPPAPLVIRGAYYSLCWVLDIIYAGRPIQRFWFLETVARMPYFVYISMVWGRGGFGGQGGLWGGWPGALGWVRM